MRSLWGTDVRALACIAGGALVGGMATAAVADASNGGHDHVSTSVTCAAEGVTPRVIVVGDASARVVVAPGVRIGEGSTCVESSRHIRVHTRVGDDGAVVAEVRMRDAEVRMREARARMEEARARADLALERARRIQAAQEELSAEEAADGLRAAEAILQRRLERMESEGVMELDELRARLAEIDARLDEQLGVDLERALQSELAAEMRRLREDIDRARREGSGN